jgi:hypothetical protein
MLTHYRQQQAAAAVALRESPQDRCLQQWLNDSMHAEALALDAMLKAGETTLDAEVEKANRFVEGLR